MSERLSPQTEPIQDRWLAPVDTLRPNLGALGANILLLLGHEAATVLWTKMFMEASQRNDLAGMAITGVITVVSTTIVLEKIHHGAREIYAFRQNRHLRAVTQ